MAAQLNGASLSSEIERILKSSPAVERAFWGIEIVELDSGKSLYSLNAGRLFVPASNAKLFTLALALNRLGPGFRFTTRVLAEARPDADGHVRELQLIGGGDPNLSARAIPYRVGTVGGNPLQAIEALADQVAGQGVKHVDGGILGDDTWYVWEPYPEGWSVDDTAFDYGAPVSALTVNDNMLTLTVKPGAQADDLAVLTLQPPLEYYAIDNRVRTVAAGGARKIQIDRRLGQRQIRLWGTIPLRDAGEDVPLAIDDPAEYAALALRRALEDRGVTVDGGVSSRHRYPNEAAVASDGGVELARIESVPLREDLRITAKVSQNLHAELALRAVARARRNEGSRSAGLEEMGVYLGEIGIDSGAYHFYDASGLARLDLVTPDAIIRLLRAMYQSTARDDWIDLLPVGGQDGTLQTRLAESRAVGRIHAKTGTLAHVSALSGYAQRRDGAWVAFSILANNHNGHTPEVRGVIDRICNLIVE